MRKRITSLQLLCFVFLQIICVAQEKDFPENFDYGNIDKNGYHNSFFKVDITFDTTWFVQNKEQIERLSKTGRDLIAGDNKNLQAVIKASQVNTASLLSIFKYELGSPVSFNPSFLVVSENTKSLPGIKRGEDYLFHAKNLLEQAQITYSFERDIYEKKIGSKIFDIMEAKTIFRNREITQEYISTVINGFCLSFILSYTNDDERNELYSILEKVKI